MGVSLREMFVSLGLDVDSAAFASGQAAVDAIEKGLDKIVEAAKKVADIFIDAVQETAAASSEISRLSQRTGISTTALQEFGYAAKRSGLSTDDLVIALQHMSRMTLQASDGSETAQKAFAHLGIKTREANGTFIASDVLLGELADKFSKMPDGPKKSALAMELFSRQGGRLIPLLNKGRDGIQQLRDEAHDLGLVLDEASIAAGKKFSGGLTQISGILTGLQHDLAGPLIDALNPIVESFVAWVKVNREFIRQRIDRVAKAIGRALTELASIVVSLGRGILWVVDNWKLFAMILGSSVLVGILTSTVAIAEMIAEMVVAGATAVVTGAAAAASWLASAAPVVLVTLLFVALALVLEDIYQWLTGGKSVIGELGPLWTKFIDDFTAPHEGDPWWLAVLRAALHVVMDLQVEIPKLMKQLLMLGTTAGQIMMVANAIRGMQPGAPAGAVIGGGASSPAAAARLQAAQQFLKESAIQIHTNVTVNAAPGQSTQDLAGHVAKQIDEHQKARLREAQAALGH